MEYINGKSQVTTSPDTIKKGPRQYKSIIPKIMKPRKLHNESYQIRRSVFTIFNEGKPVLLYIMVPPMMNSNAQHAPTPWIGFHLNLTPI